MDRKILHFAKYHGAGNDFVLLDAWEEAICLTENQIQSICDRHFGIGADGLIIIRPSESVDYQMVYHNADGQLGSMCGNGARCAFMFARGNGYVGDNVAFTAFDGLHTARSLPNDWVEVSMSDVGSLSMLSGDCILDTGSPHFVRFVPDISLIDVVKDGRSIRYSKAYADNGINVNFVEIRSEVLRIKTYERGVEDRTLACGTGATAVALAYAEQKGLLSGPVALRADGGDLSVNFTRTAQGFTDVVLRGPAKEVYTGSWLLDA